MPKGRERPRATCHPDKWHHAKGLCKTCWQTVKRGGLKETKTDRGVICRCKFNYYRHNAKRRGIPWFLTFDEFRSMVFNKCVYCGAEPFTHSASHQRSAYTNGVDRSVNETGYVVGNCVTCCEICNRAKGAMKLADFMAWVRRISVCKLPV